MSLDGWGARRNEYVATLCTRLVATTKKGVGADAVAAEPNCPIRQVAFPRCHTWHSDFGRASLSCSSNDGCVYLCSWPGGVQVFMLTRARKYNRNIQVEDTAGV